MYGLSLHQPWASAMARRSAPQKSIETRSWRPDGPFPIRDVVIHAAAKWSRKQLEICSQHPFTQIFEVHPHLLKGAKLTEAAEALGLPLGAAVCVVDVVRISRTGALVELAKRSEDGAAEGWYEELKMGDYAPGRFGWETGNLRILDRPVPMKGRQGLFLLTADEERAVRASMESHHE